MIKYVVFHGWRVIMMMMMMVMKNRRRRRTRGPKFLLFDTCRPVAAKYTELETRRGDLNFRTQPRQQKFWSISPRLFSECRLSSHNISSSFQGGSGCVVQGTEGKVHKANLSEVTLGLTGPSTYPPPPQHSHEPALFWATITIHPWLNSTQICIQRGWKPVGPICVKFPQGKISKWWYTQPWNTKTWFGLGDNGDQGEVSTIIIGIGSFIDWLLINRESNGQIL